MTNDPVGKTDAIVKKSKYQVSCRLDNAIENEDGVSSRKGVADDVGDPVRAIRAKKERTRVRALQRLAWLPEP